MNKLLVLTCFLCAILFAMSGIAHAEVIVSGILSEDAVWSRESGPYIINDELLIEDGVTLVIEPGTAVTIDGPLAGIRTRGKVVARGFDSQWITFTSFASRSFAFIAAEKGGSLDFHKVMIEGVDEVSASGAGFIDMDRVALLGGSVKVESSAVKINSSKLSADGLATTVQVSSLEATSSVVVSNSSIGASQGIAVDVDGPSIVRMPFNFWGHSSGPYHELRNPEGSGFEIRGEAAFEPWLIGEETVPWSQLCCSNILFLPGIKASRLYASREDGEARLWEPTGNSDVQALALGGESTPNVYVKAGDVITEAYPGMLGLNLYKSASRDFDDLVSSALIREWIPVSYDWRHGVDSVLSESSVMGDFLRLVETSKTGRVSIVAHSNGGLLAKALIMRLEGEGRDSLVDKVILVGSPQAGTPQAFGSVLHGFNEGIFPFASSQSIMDASRTMPASYGLFPSSAYVPEDEIPIVALSGEYPSITISSGDGLFDFVSSGAMLSGAPVARRGSSFVSSDLLNSARDLHRSIDSWVPSSHIKFVQIAGVGLDTLAGLEYRANNVKGVSKIKYKPLITLKGDGVVTRGSASFIEERPYVHTVFVNLARALLGGHSHADMLEDDLVRSVVIDELKNYDSPNYPVASAGLSHEQALHYSADKVRVYVYSSEGSASFVVTDSFGNRSGITSDGFVEEGIPGSQCRSYGDVSYVSMPCSLCPGYSGPFEISILPISSSTDSVELEIEWVRGGSVVASSSSGYVPLPEGGALVSVGGGPSQVDFSSFEHVVNPDEDEDEVSVDRPEPVLDTEDNPESGEFAVESLALGGRARVAVASSKNEAPSSVPAINIIKPNLHQAPEPDQVTVVSVPYDQYSAAVEEVSTSGDFLMAASAYESQKSLGLSIKGILFLLSLIGFLILMILAK